MAAPIFTYYSTFQSGFTANNVDSQALLYEISKSNGYDLVPGFAIRNNTQANRSFGKVEFSPLATGWCRFMYDMARGDADKPFVTFRGATADLLRIVCATTTSSSSPLRFEYYDGAAWVQIGADVPASENNNIDIQWTISDTVGVFRFFASGVLLLEFTGDTLRAGDTAIESVTFTSADEYFVYETSFWHIFIDSVDSRGLNLTQDYAQTNGFYNTMSNGTYTSVDDYPNNSTAYLSYLIADADGEKFTAPMNTVNTTLASTGVVETVFLTAWGVANAEPALYLKPLVRKASIDYTPGASVQFNATDDLIYGVELAVDPSTGAPWASVADVQAFEYGWEASATGV